MKEFLGFRENECASKLDALSCLSLSYDLIRKRRAIAIYYRIQDVDMSVRDRFICRKAVDDR